MSAPGGPSDTDVLIVGAGPTGLTLAALLAEAGVRFRLVERAAVASDKSRALVVHARTLELLDKLDVAAPLLAIGRRAVAARVYIEKQKAFDVELGDVGVTDTPYSFVLFVSQAETEAALTKALEDRGGTIERGLDVKELTQDGDGITAKCVHLADNREETIRARYVVGCDGAHSVVRHAGSFTFEGEPYLQDFVLADVLVDFEDADDAVPRLTLCFNDDGLVALFPFEQKGRFRVIATRPDAPKDASDPTLEEAQALVDRFTPLRTKLHDPKWLTRFRLHHRQADRYRDGRFFLAGDAAHIHSPAGGQGMNTGIYDAFNLGWKLALVLKEHAHEALLGTYDEERHPVGAQLLRTTDRMFSLNTSKNRAILALRNFVVRRIAPMLVKTRGKTAAFRFLSELDIAYPKSSLVLERGLRLEHPPRAGMRAPDAKLDGATVFEATKELGHHLLVFAEDQPKARAFASEMKSAHPWLVAHVVPRGASEARKRFGIPDEGVVLVRPDGYIGARSVGLDGGVVEAAKQRIFG
ncbi:MAG TPA: FAD-dependent monooxygenase [Polyangiaceae bacterium]